MLKIQKAFYFILAVFCLINTASAADENLDTNTLPDFSEARFYVGLGIDNISERRSTDSSFYGMVEASSFVLHDPTGLRFRLGADLSDVGFWAGAGISIEHVFVNTPTYVEASILAGYYDAGNDLDLSHDLEFRSQFAVGHIMDNGYDVAVGISHKSNASIGDLNPGSEAVFIRLGRGF